MWARAVFYGLGLFLLFRLSFVSRPSPPLARLFHCSLSPYTLPILSKSLWMLFLGSPLPFSSASSSATRLGLVLRPPPPPVPASLLPLVTLLSL